MNEYEVTAINFEIQKNEIRETCFTLYVIVKRIIHLVGKCSLSIYLILKNTLLSNSILIGVK